MTDFKHLTMVAAWRTNGVTPEKLVQLEPAQLPMLLLQSLQLQRELWPTMSTEHQKQMALAMVADAKALYQISDQDKQIIDYIIEKVLPQMVDLFLDIASGKYDLQLSRIKQFLANISQCVVAPCHANDC